MCTQLHMFKLSTFAPLDYTTYLCSLIHYIENYEEKHRSISSPSDVFIIVAEDFNLLRDVCRLWESDKGAAAHRS